MGRGLQGVFRWQGPHGEVVLRGAWQRYRAVGLQTNEVRRVGWGARWKRCL